MVFVETVTASGYKAWATGIGLRFSLGCVRLSRPFNPGYARR